MNIEINIQINENLPESIGNQWLQTVIKESLKFEKKDSIELGLVITNDEQVHELNKTYRGIDDTTDVLSFALLEGEETFIMPPDTLIHLGEVIISYPQTIKQAKEYNHTIEKELAGLIIHGVLHLLGYDHQTDEAEKQMKSHEDAILHKISLVK
ncbi:MAG: rRNA maturation RNase YbeY [Chloroflexi bacterium]|nr:rRNA maturation RNase YbeY [Chloroflexota bacterium]